MGLLIAIGLMIAMAGGLCNGIYQYIIVPRRMAQAQLDMERRKTALQAQKQAEKRRNDTEVLPYMYEQLNAYNAQIAAYTRMIDILEKQAKTETDYVEQTKLWKKQADLSARMGRIAEKAWKLQEKLDS